METENLKDGQKSEKKKKKHSAKYYLAELLIKIGIFVLLLWILLNFIVMVSVCHDNSSYPMIKDGDFCLTYRLAEIRQGDEITYIKDDKIKIGRAVAFGGDTVDIQNNSVSVNGLNIAENVVYPTNSQGSDIEFPYKIPEVSDSRKYGGISLSDVKGVVVFIMRRRGI